MPLTKKNVQSETPLENESILSHRKTLSVNEQLSNYFKGSNKAKSVLMNYQGAGPLGKTFHKKKKYLKKFNDNPRYAASKHGSILGGLICGLHKTDKKEEE